MRQILFSAAVAAGVLFGAAAPSQAKASWLSESMHRQYDRGYYTYPYYRPAYSYYYSPDYYDDDYYYAPSYYYRDSYYVPYRSYYYGGSYYRPWYGQSHEWHEGHGHGGHGGHGGHHR
jgi:hypothetical protein